MSETALSPENLAKQIQRRRTFAIISHPDAGKTTLTEKLLLYSGMLRTAGMVGGRKGRKAAASDWMSMEQERGISITASAMQFTYKDVVINVLDTPGHQDFSEDTYRTVTAADSVIMVIDAAKGVELQTRKLFEVCRLQKIPVFTFINKMDLPGQDPLDLMSNVEDVLNIQASAINWPTGSGDRFSGIVDRKTNILYRYTKTAAGGAALPDVEKIPIDEYVVDHRIGEQHLEDLKEDLELLQEAGNQFTMEDFLAGKVTPVYFGSAMNNYGVEFLFDAFVNLAPPPSGRPADKKDGSEVMIEPEDMDFSAYVFKLQANMDKRHRDCVAFMRINSGQLEKDLMVNHYRMGKKVRLPRPHNLMTDKRTTAMEAYPGDIIGVMNPGLFEIGDTISVQKGIKFKPLPRFQPEFFARIRPSDTSKRKAMDKGLKQLVAEGAIQLLFEKAAYGAYPIVAVVGKLQYEVLQYRLRDEYRCETDLVPLSLGASAWLIGDPDTFKKPLNALFAIDHEDKLMVLFTSTWEKDYAMRENPDHQLVDYSQEAVRRV